MNRLLSTTDETPRPASSSKTKINGPEGKLGDDGEFAKDFLVDLIQRDKWMDIDNLSLGNDGYQAVAFNRRS